MSAQLRRLILANIRNLGTLDLNLGAKFNVFVGANGSGKTSLLEAIYVLGLGRSFRARSLQNVITFGEDHYLIRARLHQPTDSEQNDVWVAVRRGLDGELQYKIGEQLQKSSAELSSLLPVQLIDSNSHLLLDGGPDFRRQFVDWGVFHVEHDFLSNWRAMRRALEQRNAALKQRQLPSAAWNETFIRYAELVDKSRRTYLDGFVPVLKEMLERFLPLGDIKLGYKRGWPETSTLTEALLSNAGLDLACGYTNIGPQRSDLEILLDGRPAKTVLSGGQRKLFVCIMLLARAQMLSDKKTSIFLIDDLHAELDKNNCGTLIKALMELDAQVFITGIEEDLIRTRLEGCDVQMFHVEQGVVKNNKVELEEIGG